MGIERRPKEWSEVLLAKNPDRERGILAFLAASESGRMKGWRDE